MKSLSLWIYDLSIRIFAPGVFIGSGFNKKAQQWLEGRRKKFPVLPEKTGKRIWVHCASLGEFEQARPVIENWGCSHPDDIIILTFFSPSGYEIRKEYQCADAILYLPLDTKANAKEFLNWAKPDIALFVKYEFWFHYLNELSQQSIPVILFSSVFRPNQIFFKWYGRFFRKMLSMFSKIFVQNSASQELLKSISIKSEIAFDTRFDRVFQIAEERNSFPGIEKFRGTSKVLVAGSTWPGDEQLILSLMKDNQIENLKYIIAPHDIDKRRLIQLKESIPLRSELLSRLNEDNAESIEVLIVDTMGQLASLYAYSDFAYVGGGFNSGIHNVLEAAVYGIPVFVGPKYTKSIEALELIDRKGLFSISSASEFCQLLLPLLNDDQESARFIENQNYVTRRVGGTKEVTEAMSYLLKR